MQKQLDPNGGIARIAELLHQKNQILEDIPFLEGNLLTGHQSTQRTGLPTPTWRLLNSQTPPTKATTVQVTDACGTVETWVEVEKDVAELGGNPQAVLANQFSAHAEAVGQEVAQTIFYGNATVAPEEFTGLAARFSSTSAELGQNIIKAGGSGSDNASIWVIDWGEGVHGIYPKGKQGGLSFSNKGIETKETTSGLSEVYRARFKWDCGLSVPDWRNIVRICNIDTSDLAINTAADLYQGLIRAMVRLPNAMPTSRTRIYMNRTVWSWLDIQARNNVRGAINSSTAMRMTEGQGGMSYDNVDGRPIWSFRGVPVRICDVLTNTEATVS